MKNLKNEKGVTLLVLTITIIVLLIVTNIVFYNSRGQIALKKVNNLYSDIEAINTKVSDYYLANNSLPILENNPYLASKSALNILLISNGGAGDIVNANDNGAYYVIDLSKLENLTLNYGRDYENWDDDSTYETYQDIYIINTVTHQIYYPAGITLDDTVYFARNIDTDTVEEALVSTTSITDDEFTLDSISVSTSAITETEQVIIADITMTINSDDFQIGTLQYGWIDDTSDVSDLVYTNFSLDDTGAATLVSKQIDISADEANYYLYIRIFDVNGDCHTISEMVTI